MTSPSTPNGCTRSLEAQIDGCSAHRSFIQGTVDPSLVGRDHRLCFRVLGAPAGVDVTFSEGYLGDDRTNMRRLFTLVCASLLLVTGISTPVAHAAGPTDSRKWSPPLVYHGGPVMTKVENYVVLWTGGRKNAFAKEYVSLLQRWQKDARHMTVFKSTMQYAQSDGQHPTDTAYRATYFVDTPFPGRGPCARRCVDNRQVVRVAAAVAATHRLKRGMQTLIHVYTPAGVDSCVTLRNNDTECDSNLEGPDGDGHCGYHTNDVKGGKALVLTHVPYLKSDCYPSDGSERFPNNRAADAAISRTSRLQMEAITDPLFNAWYDGEDQVKVENGDECDDVFGPKLPGRGGNSYYKGHTYDVQAMASNKDEGCVVDSRPNGF